MNKHIELYGGVSQLDPNQATEKKELSSNSEEIVGEKLKVEPKPAKASKGSKAVKNGDK